MAENWHLMVKVDESEKITANDEADHTQHEINFIDREITVYNAQITQNEHKLDELRRQSNELSTTLVSPLLNIKKKNTSQST